VRRALVTGVTGFVGAHLARALLADGIEVHAVVRPGANLHRIPDLVDRVVLHDDEGTAAALDRAVVAGAPEVTFHLATRFVGEHGPNEVGPLVVDNVAFPARLADALARAGAAHLVNVGTAWQHVGGAEYRPKNLYAATKQAFEDVLAHYQERGTLRTVTVNLYDTYGPLDHRPKLLALLRRAVETGQTLELSSGGQLLDLVHVDDVVGALRLAADRCRDGTVAPGSRFSASSGEARTVRDVVAVFDRVAGRPVPVHWGARPDRPGEMLEHWDAGPPVPGWSPGIDLERGLADLLAERQGPASSASRG
jgi:nucleoside-diphosphate-sugar epimerase